MVVFILLQYELHPSRIQEQDSPDRREWLVRMGASGYGLWEMYCFWFARDT